ncbi:MAG: hypothetical protein WBB66_03270 [Candidatus Omnitrophota bacterium]
MRKVRGIMVMAVVLSMIFPPQAFSQRANKWEKVLSSRKPVNIYVENIANKSKDHHVSADKVTDIVKNIFAKRRQPRFNVVDKKSAADIVFKGKIIEFIWMKKAPITDIYGAGALATDIATSHLRKYARMRVEYEISDAKTGKVLIDQVTQVTLKKFKLPKDESYGMIYKRAPKILTMDIFKRYKRYRNR